MTLTHTYYDRGYRSESYTISVTETKAAIYFLSSPAGKPESNDTQYWSPDTDTSTWLADIHVNGATWQQVDGIDKNIISNVGSNIDSWPNSSTGGDSWVLERNGVNKDAFTAILDSMWDNYKTDIAKKLNVDSDDLQKKDISKITLKAYKISRNNSNTDNQFFHIDCTIDVVSASSFATKFWVKYPGNNGTDTDYRLVDTAVYRPNSSVNNTEVVDQKDQEGNIAVPLTMVKNGVTYRLTGWYPEDSTGGAYDANKRLALTSSWTYSPTKQELEDGTVNFYAHYEPVSANLTVSKTVTGLLGDHHQQFTFQIVDADGNAVPLTKENITVNIDNVNADDQTKVGLINNGTDGKFTLVSGASVTIKNLAGNYKIVEETVTGYETKWQLDAENEVLNSTEASVTMSGTDRTLAFTNHCSIIPDTGVILDTLPYIVILAVVVGGGVMLFLRKRRKDDED